MEDAEPLRDSATADALFKYVESMFDELEVIVSFEFVRAIVDDIVEDDGIPLTIDAIALRDAIPALSAPLAS